jgi:hypothetical protein
MRYEIGEERKNGNLLKTGQTTQYGGYQDDGYFKKGISRLYTILTTGRYSGTTNITLNSKTDVHSNNCVYDQRTKLMWSRYVTASVGPASDGLIPFTTNGSGEGLFPYAAAANAALLAGYSDWRVPNVLEFNSLLNFESPKCDPDPASFPGWTSAAWYATSTTSPPSSTQFKVIMTQFGNMDNDDKTTTRLLLLVRGG